MDDSGLHGSELSGNGPAAGLTRRGSVPQPAPALSYSRFPVTAANPGRTIRLPAPQPLDVTQRYHQASSVSFTDGLNAQTTYFYHVELRDLDPDTTYYYQVSDGATTPSAAGASFTTAPAGRARFRFSSYGDLATPSYDLNASGNQWHESCDNSHYAVAAIENPGGGGTGGPTNTYGTDTSTGLPEAKVITERNAISGSEAAGFTRNSADSREDAPWSAKTNGGDAYGYAIFDVDPGRRRGETTIMFSFFAIPAVSDETGPLHTGTTTLPSTPYETFVFGRGLARRAGNAGHDATPLTTTTA
jgi:Purple acid Phosphatase, N-terminal domain